MRSRNSRFMLSICRCQAFASAAPSRNAPSHRTGRVCAARVLPAMAGHAPASHASVASGRSNRRTTFPKKSPALSMGTGILTQTTGADGRACTEDLSMRKLRVRVGIIFRFFAFCFVVAEKRARRRYRLRVRTEPSQGSNPGSIPGIATKLQYESRYKPDGFKKYSKGADKRKRA